MKYNVDEIFKLDDDYYNKAKYCNDNGLVIKEVTQENDKERYFKIQKLPEATLDQILNQLRKRREYECFSIINRGFLWYNKLTEEQKNELAIWYQEWLDITDKYEDGIDIETIIPKKPKWLK